VSAAPDRDRWVPVPREALDVVREGQVTAAEAAVFLALGMVVWGRRVRSARVSVGELARLTRRNPRTVRRAFAALDLLRKGWVTRVDNMPGRAACTAPLTDGWPAEPERPYGAIPRTRDGRGWVAVPLDVLERACGARLAERAMRTFAVVAEAVHREQHELRPAAIAAQLGIDRTHARAALRELAAAGVIERPAMAAGVWYRATTPRWAGGGARPLGQERSSPGREESAPRAAEVHSPRASEVHSGRAAGVHGIEISEEIKERPPVASRAAAPRDREVVPDVDGELEKEHQEPEPVIQFTPDVLDSILSKFAPSRESRPAHRADAAKAEQADRARLDARRALLREQLRQLQGRTLA
jgi:hypothetical protein